MAITGTLPVIPTPFRDGRFDPDSFQHLIDHSLDQLDGYTLLGSTGEAPSLPLDERMRIAEMALAMTPAGKDVVVGVSHTSIDDATTLASHAQEHGARAVLCSAPYYFPNTPDGMLAHLGRLDAVLEIDLVLYDNSVATKTVLRPDWVLHWADQLEHLRSVKLTDHDLSKVATWQDAGLTVLAGDDPILFEFLAAGVDGAMVIVPSILPGSFLAVCERFAAGDPEGAMRIFAGELAPFIHAFGIGEEIATSKALLADIGVFDSAETLSPLAGTHAERTKTLRVAYESCREAEGRRLEVGATA